MKASRSKWPTQLGLGLVAGAGIAYVDNGAFGGEVSPIIIVVLLVGATAMAGAAWGRRVDCGGRHMGMRTDGSPFQARPQLARHSAPKHLYFDPVSGSVHAGSRNLRHGLRSPGPQTCDWPSEARSGAGLTTYAWLTPLAWMKRPRLSTYP